MKSLPFVFSNLQMIGVPHWPLASVALALVEKVSFVSSFQLTDPTNSAIKLKRCPQADLKTTTTKAGGVLIDQLSKSLVLSPLERVALTCAGNLQMVFSSFYMKPVKVEVELFDESSDDDDKEVDPEPLATYDRVVSMDITGSMFCKATSKVRVYDADLYHMLSTEDVGIGQLLRLRNLMPKFGLHDAGRNDDGGMWRFYTMDINDGIEFDIIEEFSYDAWDIISNDTH